MDQLTKEQSKIYLNNLLIETYKDLMIEKEDMSLYLKNNLERVSNLLNKCSTILKVNEKVIEDLRFELMKNQNVLYLNRIDEEPK